MSKITKLIFILIFVFLLAPSLVKAADEKQCYCYHEIPTVGDGKYVIKTQAEVSKLENNLLMTGCMNLKEMEKAGNKCDAKSYKGAQTYYDKCEITDDKDTCEISVKIWRGNKEDMLKKATAIASPTKTDTAKTDTGGLASNFIPACSRGQKLSGECREIGIFVRVAINVANYLFGVIGAIALVMFIYGGFTLILSQGNPEKVKKGFEVLGAAVTGLVIAFSAYMLINFLGSEVLGVKDKFKL